MESKLQVRESSFIAPREAEPKEKEKRLWLSPIDLWQAVGHTPMVYLYRAKSDDTAAFFDVARLKEALAKALAAFYPLAGRLGVDDDGRLEIRCNDEGVLFVVAEFGLTADEFDFKPSSELRKIFVPCIEPSSVITAIQVTFLKGDGVVLGTAIHHAAVDGVSAFHFLQTWAALCRDGDGAAVELPFYDRTLLRPRSPPVVDPDALSMLVPVSSTSTQPSGPTAVEVFTISPDQVATLRRTCGGASTFCSVSALVWQCTCAARRLPPDARARLMFPVNVRRRASPPLPDRYFGNAVVRIAASGAAGDVACEPLASVAGRVAAAIAKVHGELVRSAIDHLVLPGTVDGRPVASSLPETDLRVNSWLGMPMYDADFGWGKPQSVARAQPVCRGSVYLMPARAAGDCEGGSGAALRMLVCMEAGNLKSFERLLYLNIDCGEKL